MPPIDVVLEGGSHGSTFSATWAATLPRGWPGGLSIDSIYFAGRLGRPAAVCSLGSLPGLGAEQPTACC